MAVASDLLTVDEVAALVRVHRRTVSGWIADGRLRAHRMGPRVTRIHRGDLRRFMAESKRTEETTAASGALATRDGNSEAAASANSSAA